MYCNLYHFCSAVDVGVAGQSSPEGNMTRCPSGFDFTYNGHCYYYYNDSAKATFFAASDVNILI